MDKMFVSQEFRHLTHSALSTLLGFTPDTTNSPLSLSSLPTRTKRRMRKKVGSGADQSQCEIGIVRARSMESPLDRSATVSRFGHRSAVAQTRENLVMERDGE